MNFLHNWNGYWITGGSDPAPYLRKNFELEALPQKAVLYLCGLGWHELYINGKKADDRVLAPTVSQFDQHVAYIPYDVTSLLRKGRNAVTVLLGNGLYNCKTLEVWHFHMAPWMDNPKMICDLECDGKIILSSDNSWKKIPSPILFNQLRNGETYDARKEIPGVTEADFDDSSYPPSGYCNPPGGDFVQENQEPCRICKSFEAVPREVRLNEFFCDFKINLTGWCEIEVEGKSGTEIVIEYGERVTDDFQLERKDISQHIKGGEFQTDHYILKGTGHEVWHPRFTYHGFQYCTVKIKNGTAKLHRVTAQFVHTDFEANGSFECSDAMANRLQANTIQSYLSNYTGIPTDCPHREKNGWTGDAQIAMETGLWNFSCARAASHFTQVLADTQRPSGQLPGVAPSAGFGYNWGSGPGWDFCLFELPYRVWLYTGDDTLLKKYLPAMEKYLHYCKSHDHGSLVNFGLGDWCALTDSEPMPPVEMTSSAYYYRMTKIVAIYKKEYEEKAQSIADAINRKFYKGNGIYAEGQRTALACALYFGFAVEPEKTAARLAEAVRKFKHTMGYGLFGSKYILRALADYGYAEDAFKVLTQTEYPGMGYWVKSYNATTLAESWPSHISRNHIMFGDISAWMYQYLAGITPLEEAPGFRKFKIKPCFVPQLDYVKAEHKSPFGMIAVFWKKENGVISFECTVPAGSQADIELPDGISQNITGHFSHSVK